MTTKKTTIKIEKPRFENEARRVYRIRKINAIATMETILAITTPVQQLLAIISEDSAPLPSIALLKKSIAPAKAALAGAVSGIFSRAVMPSKLSSISAEFNVQGGYVKIQFTETTKAKDGKHEVRDYELSFRANARPLISRYLSEVNHGDKAKLEKFVEEFMSI